MKDIKFIAFDKKKGKLLESEYLHYCGGSWYESFRDLEDGVPLDLENVEIMQYTGLKDKNGVEIYEGDILKGKQYFTTAPHVPTEIIGEVKYSTITTMFNVERAMSKRVFPISLGNDIYTFEIIGNVYENPELLKNIKTIS